MDSKFLSMILATLVVAAGSALDKPTSGGLHTAAMTHDSKQNVHDNGKHSRLLQDFGSRLTDTASPNTSASDVVPAIGWSRDATAWGPATGDREGMLMAGAGRRKSSKSKRGDEDDDEDKKTLSQQIADGKYGLIEKEIYATTPKRPGIISYAPNPEVPRDTAKNLGGLEPEEIWLAENHVLVLRGGYFPEHKFNRTDDTATAWPPIDDFNAPQRQVKIPANPKVPPPFPVQLTDDGPTQFIGFNGTAGPPPFPPFFPQPLPPGNGSYLPPFPPPGNFTPGFYPPVPPGNFTPGGGFYPPPGNGSFSPPQFPYPLPPPRNESYFAPPPGNFTPGSGPFYPPPFPGFPPLPHNGTLYPPYLFPGIFTPPLPHNGTLPFPNLPPGAAFLPPPGNLTELLDEDDPSLYYPPPYDFYYPQNNSTEVPPGPLVPGVILPPPPNFFAPLNNHSDEKSKPLPTTTETPAPPYGTFLPGLSPPPVTKHRRPSLTYLPVITEDRKVRPRPTVSIVDNDALNHITPIPETDFVTTPSPKEENSDRYSEKPPRPPINIAPQNVQVTHQGKSPIEQIPQQGYYYEEPTIVVTPAPETVYNTVQNDIILTTAVPSVSYYTAPLTDIIVQPTPGIQHAINGSHQNAYYQHDYSNQHSVQGESPAKRGKEVSTPTTTLAPLLVYYNSQRQPENTETNTVAPSPEPYFLKTKGGVTATVSPPLVYYTVPSVGTTRNPTSVKTSFYFYEEPHEGSRQVSNADSSSPTQALPSKHDKPTTSPGRHYNEEVPPTPQPYYNGPPIGGKSVSPKVLPAQYAYSDVLPLGHSVKDTIQTEQPEQYVYADALPVEHSAKNPTQMVHSQVYSDVLPVGAPAKGPTQPQEYIYSGVVAVGRAKGVAQRTRPQQYVLSSASPVGQQVVFPSSIRKVPQSSTPVPPQYYYLTVSPDLQYEVVGSTTPSIINQNYPTQPSRQEHVKSTPQPLPLVSKLTYFTTPRPDTAYLISSQRPILYIKPSSSPRPIYQYSYEKNGRNPETQEPRQRPIYIATRTKSRTPHRLNYQADRQGAVQYQTTPRTLFEYSYEQSTSAPQVQQFYSAAAAAPQYDQEDVTAGSPATHYGYEGSGKQNQQRQEYQSKPQQRYRAHQRPQVPQVNIYPTANPLHAYFTQQDEKLLDDITKKYFTIFGKKLPSGDENVPTTPIPLYAGGNVQPQSERPYTVNAERQYYATPTPNYNIQNNEQAPENVRGRKVPVSLADDVNINYKKPSPPVNPLSEFIDTRQLSNLETGRALVSYRFPGDGSHFYFITPQIADAQQAQNADEYVYAISSQGPHQLVRYRRKKRKQQR
jgi:hypothetical protein